MSIKESATQSSAGGDTIRPAIPADAEAILALIEACKLFLVQQGIDQWHPRINYPNAADVERDTTEASLYCLVNESGALLGIVTLTTHAPAEYAQINWADPSAKALIVKRLAIDPARQGGGLAHRLMDFAETHARENDFAVVRLDAYKLNPRAHKVYTRRGYADRGDVFFPLREASFTCFELKLK